MHHRPANQGAVLKPSSPYNSPKVAQRLPTTRHRRRLVRANHAPTEVRRFLDRGIAGPTGPGQTPANAVKQRVRNGLKLGSRRSQAKTRRSCRGSSRRRRARRTVRCCRSPYFVGAHNTITQIHNTFRELLTRRPLVGRLTRPSPSVRAKICSEANPR